MDYSPILLPIVILVAWSLIVMLWMAATRLPAMKRAGIDINTLVGGRGQNLEGVVPDEVMWKSHNYQHLMEQPTVFYAVALVLAIIGSGGGANLWLAWAYVIIRIMHTLVQATINVVKYRFLLFLLSSVALVALTINALRDLL
ncbi:MAG TPA: MAPEG family protein [Sphingomicrobium sp.]|jgi:hypothetical protein|nr:MAPEG family protein [Sphingomicrobium sp.]